MNEFYSRQRWLRLLLFASFLAFASAAKVVSKQVGQMSLLEVEEALQVSGIPPRGLRAREVSEQINADYRCSNAPWFKS